MDPAGSVYGAGRTQNTFSLNPIEFLKRPITILRILSWFFSIIVFSCISSGGYVEDTCIMNRDNGACGYGIFVGVVAFLACIAFTVVDILLERLSSVQQRKYAVLADLGFSGVWAFFYFVSFCYMTNKVATTPQSFIDEKSVAGWQLSNVRASIAFSFFSILSFAGLAFFGFQRFRQGDMGAFDSSDQVESQVGSGYPGFGGGSATQPQGGYQQQPFGQGGNTGANVGSGDLSSGAQQYQQPSY